MTGPDCTDQVQSTETIMDLLRESTRDLHNSAEGNEFQRLLASGKISQVDLTRYLGQVYLMHRTLADLLSQAQPRHPAVAKILKPHHLDLTCIKNDLAFFKAELPSEELEATSRILLSMRLTAAENVSGLLGYLYVLEGSTHGAKFIAKNLRAGLNLIDLNGVSYFDRYGDRQRERWLSFKNDMNGAKFNAKEKATIVEAARATFFSFQSLGEELLSSL